MDTHDTYDSPCTDLANLRTQRNRLLAMHQHLIENARHALHSKPSVDHEFPKSELENALADSEKIIKQQCKRIAELQEFESLYKSLLLQYELLESTHNKLVDQVLDIDYRADEREELEQLIAIQKETLLELRNKLRKIETRYEQSVEEISVSKKENKQLRLILEQLKANLATIFDQHQSAKQEADRLRHLVRNQEISHTQLMNEYENLRSEYEALYRNLSSKV